MIISLALHTNTTHFGHTFSWLEWLWKIVQITKQNFQVMYIQCAAFVQNHFKVYFPQMVAGWPAPSRYMRTHTWCSALVTIHKSTYSVLVTCWNTCSTASVHVTQCLQHLLTWWWGDSDHPPSCWCCWPVQQSDFYAESSAEHSLALLGWLLWYGSQGEKTHSSWAREQEQSLGFLHIQLIQVGFTHWHISRSI